MSFVRSFALFVFIAILPPPASAATVIVHTSQSANEYIQKNAGPLLDESQLPILRKTLQKIYQLLAAEVPKRQNVDPDFTSEFLILDSVAFKAFTLIIQDPQKTQIHHSVTLLTTGLIHELMDGVDPVTGIYRIAGVFAHELAHVIDKADPNGLEQRAGYRANNQPIEIRTDAEGLLLARDAGLPANIVYECLKGIYKNQKYGFINRAKAFRSTHPEPDTRFAAQRIVLTLDRVRNGLNLTGLSLSPKDVAAIDDEIKTIRVPPSFRLPKDPAEFRSWFGKPFMRELDKEEFNALTLWFDHYLLDHPEIDIRDPVLNSIRLNFLSYTIHSLCNSKTCLEELFAGSRIEGLEKLEPIPHEQFVKQLPFYNSPDLLTPRIQTHPGQDDFETVFIGAMFDPAKAFSSSLIFPYLLDLERRNNKFAVGILYRLVEIQLNSGGSISNEDFILYTHHLHASLFEGYVDSQLYRNSKASGSDADGIGFSYSYFVPTKKSRSLWRSLLSRAEPEQIRAQTLETLNLIWQNRGTWAYLEFSSTPPFEVDWDFLAEVLQIPRERLNNEIQTEFKRFLVKQVESGKAIGPNFRTSPGHILHRKVLPWMPAQLDGKLLKATNLAPFPRVQEAYRSIFANAIYRFTPEVIKQRFRSDLKAQLIARGAANPEQIWQTLQIVEENINGTPSWSVAFMPDILEQIEVAMGEAGLTAQLKNEFLVSAFANKALELELVLPTTWHLLNRAAQAIGPEKDTIDFIQRFSEKDPMRFRRATWAALFNLTDEVELEIGERVKAADKLEVLAYIEKLSRMISGHYKVNEFGKSDELSKFITQKIQSLELTPVEKLKVFWQITSWSVTLDTDSYLRDILLPEIKTHRDGRLLELLLLKGRVREPALNIALAEVRLGDRLRDEEVVDLIKELNRLVPEASGAKDVLLERLAWSREIAGDILGVVIESAKSTNWRNYDVGKIKYSSLVTEVLKVTEPGDRMQILDYLIGGKPREASLDAVLANVRSKLLRVAEAAPRHSLIGSPEELVEKKIAQFRSEMVDQVNKSSPQQRMPFVEYILTTGERNVVDDSSFLAELLYSHLGIQSGSVENAVLRAYLDILPEHERHLQLSYILLNSGQTAGGPRLNFQVIFESFGTVGIKFGQLAYLWNLFGSEYSEQLETLFDNADPMTKFEIEKVLKDQLGEVVYGQTIKRLVRILGSASVKTVVLAELQDGRRVALMIKRPRAKNQTATNLLYAKNFLSRLKHYALESPNSLFTPMVDAVEDQIETEMNFTNEIKNYELLRNVLEQIAPTLTAGSDWHIHVPLILDEIPATNDLFAMEAVDGVPADTYLNDKSVAKADRDIVAEMLTQVSLSMLFKNGVFDPDRHPKNWLIDPKTKAINFIDVGQMISVDFSRSPFKSDGRLKIAQFLKAINEGNANAMIKAAFELREVSDPHLAVDEQALRQGLQKVLRDFAAEPKEQQLKLVLEEIYRSGLRFKSTYTFGILKGFLVLSGSKYTSPETFKSILRSQIVKLYQQKIFVVLDSAVRSWSERALPNLANGRKEGLGRTCRDSLISRGFSSRRP